jgi:hypothetical protein
MGDGNIAQRAVLAVLTALSAVVIPATMPALGRTASSLVMVVPMMFFAVLGAYSFHHAVDVIIEQPAQAAHVATLAPLQARLDVSEKRLATTQAKLDAYPSLQLDPTMPKGRVEAQRQAWKDGLDPLDKAVNAAKSDRNADSDKLEAAKNAYTPLAAQEIIWIAGLVADLSLALGFFGLERTAHTIALKAKRERAEARNRTLRALERVEIAKHRAKQKRAAAKKPAPAPVAKTPTLTLVK